MTNIIPFKPIPFHEVINALVGTGLSQREIADMVESSQPFISDLARQEREQCETPMGFRLYSLYAERVLGSEIVLRPVKRKVAAIDRPARRKSE